MIITDSELATSYSAKKMKIPVIGIHNHNLDRIKNLKENKNLNLRLQAKYLYKLVEAGNKNCSRVIIPELIGKKKKGKINYINPIINEEKGIIKNNAILIMLGGSRFTHPFIEKIIPFLKKQNENFRDGGTSQVGDDKSQKSGKVDWKKPGAWKDAKTPDEKAAAAVANI